MTNEFVVMNEPFPCRRSSGYYAKYHNAWYEAFIRRGGRTIMLEARSSTPPLGFTPSLPGRSMRDVNADDLEELVKVDALCTWRSERYWINSINDESVVIAPADGIDAPRLKALGFVDTLGYGSLNKQVPITEVSDIREEVADLLHRDQ